MPIYYDNIKTIMHESAASAHPNIDYYALYEAKVVSQSDDLLSVDIEPIRKNMPGMSDVPIRIGVGGITVEIKQDSLVLVGFEGADPSSPYVTSFRGEDILSITIKDQSGDELKMGGGNLTYKVNGVQVIDASSSALKLGPVGSLAVLVFGAMDSMGVPVQQAPAASATIVKAG